MMIVLCGMCLSMFMWSVELIDDGFPDGLLMLNLFYLIVNILTCILTWMVVPFVGSSIIS